MIAPSSPLLYPIVIDVLILTGDTKIRTTQTQPSADQIKDVVLQSLDDDKGLDITTIPLAGKSSIADYMVIASGTSARQISAMSDHLEEKLKKSGAAILGREGKSQGDWIVIDAIDVIVHLFRPEVREFYGLERMWATDASDEVVTVS